MNKKCIRRDIVVIGGSAGGLDAAPKIIMSLPHDLPACVAWVNHRGPLPPARQFRRSNSTCREALSMATTSALPLESRKPVTH